MRATTSAQAQALLDRWRSDPFAVLGPHSVGDGIWEIRVMAPLARAVSAIAADDGALLGALRRIHDAGLFALAVESAGKPRYRLRIDEGDGPREGLDPYAFGTVLDDDALRAVRGEGQRPVYETLGAHLRMHEGAHGVAFAVWAPNARRVSVVGDFNAWDGRRHPMRLRHDAGVWELFIPDLGPGALYKYEIEGPDGQLQPLKADPFAFFAERPPATASVVAATPRPAGPRRDNDPRPARERPISIYECHVGSWARIEAENNRYLTWRELSERLLPYVESMGFTHIELLPITEYPFDGSWGYQPVSLYAPTSRFGSADDFRFFVDESHRRGLGVLLDWAPAHFPNDPHGLARFDGTHLYEHADPQKGVHQDWGTLIYNYGRQEVAAFLIANARFWLERYGLDGLRVDAVASMLYLNYSRKPGEWTPNRHGGAENLEAIDFLRRMNETAYAASPHAITIAEESTAWQGVSHPTWTGGLGFGFKWNMGWMNDTLRFMGRDPIHRRHHHNELTFGLLYAFSENFILPLSHDEVVHSKGSLIARMPGDRWRKFANLRAYFGFMWGHPGKKLLFMGGEFAQEREWNHDRGLDWGLTGDPLHKGVQSLVRDLNAVYRRTRALHERDCESDGFEWLVADDNDNSVVAFARFARDGGDVAIVVCNFTPEVRTDYRIGAPRAGFWAQLVNTDAATYGGSDVGVMEGVRTEATPSHGRGQSLRLTLPPLAAMIFEWRGE